MPPIKNVLVIEDDEHVARSLRRFLLRRGFGVTVASSAALAIDVAKSTLVLDAVVSDIELPDGNGLDVVDEVVALRPGLSARVVFMSGSDVWIDAARARGATCLAKPFSPSVLAALLDTLLSDEP